jgi:hypothetical protein
MVLAMIGAGCSTGPGEESAAYLTYDGTFLDSGLQRVGSVSLDDGEAISSVSSDGRLAFSSHREAIPVDALQT